MQKINLKIKKSYKVKIKGERLSYKGCSIYLYFGKPHSQDGCAFYAGAVIINTFNESHKNIVKCIYFDIPNS